VTIQDAPKPSPLDDEVLIRVRATTVEIADARIRAMRVPDGLRTGARLALGWSKPKKQVLGMELAGEIEAAGKDVTRFKVGDAVVGSPGFSMGSHAEYICLKEDGGLTLKPESLSFEEAVSVLFGACTTLSFFEAGNVTAGQDILINGGSGGVGVTAVPYAKHIGARVTAVCSGANVDLVRSLGADEVVDYTKRDFTDTDKRYDVVMDNVGNASFSRVKNILKPEGVLLVVIFGSAWEMISNMFNKRAISVSQKIEKELLSNKTFARIMDLAEQGALKPTIDSTYPFEKIADAHARVDTGRKVGAVVVTL
jgi:NADPH:quinone reductase-like Zn-dependent oxidoreductase